MSFVLINSSQEVAALPDGTLITWLPVIDDPTSEAVAWVRKTRVTDPESPVCIDVWISPGNGWEPEPLTSVVFPARIVLLGVPQPGDYVPEQYLTSTDTDDGDTLTGDVGELQWATLSTGGTYPRDVALQAAATLFAKQSVVSAQVVINFAETFANWLTPVSASDQIAPLSLGSHDA